MNAVSAPAPVSAHAPVRPRPNSRPSGTATGFVPGDGNRCFTVKQVAHLWVCSTDRVRALIDDGTLRVFQIGTRLKITPDAIREAEQKLILSPAEAAAGGRRSLADRKRITSNLRVGRGKVVRRG